VTPPSRIDSSIREYIDRFNFVFLKLKNKGNTALVLKKKIEFATWVHSEFQHIHPYLDGNSRTTRILFNYVLSGFGFPLIDVYFVKDYLDVTKGESERNDKKLYGFLLMLIYDNLIRLVDELES